ncbi:MAG: primosomal protein N' [Chlorobi bacterium]|nr:primosomal protein N' [Chlorobiota bacterium]
MTAPVHFVDVLLPFALDGTYTYHCTPDQFERLQKGMRVAVEFGRQKVQTGIVVRTHREKPFFDTKPVLEILDDRPIINDKLWQLLDFVNLYYLSRPGKTMRTALPSSFLLENQTLASLRPDARIEREKLSDTAFLIVEALEKHPYLTVEDLARAGGSVAKTMKVVNRLAEEGVIDLHYLIQEKYKPKYVTYIDIHPDLGDLTKALDRIPERAAKQRELFLRFLSLYLPARHPVPKRELRKSFSDAVIRALIDRGVLAALQVPEDRQVFADARPQPVTLTPAQEEALARIREAAREGKPALLHGVTASGKTEIYIRLIRETLDRGQQVLYLVPEIGLTAQLVNRLKTHFGNRTAVYHSRYSAAERREIWMNALDGKPEAGLVIGTRSAVFVPFKNLGLVIIDEEHDEAYKEHRQEPAYHGRDTALMAARIHGAAAVLGSATPSFDSYHHAETGKYAYVPLPHTYHRTPDPEKTVLDFRQAYREGRVKGDFIRETLEAIDRTVRQGLQTIVFLNKRGYAPIVTCKTCGHTENCPHCAVSLTYHRSDGKLKCHYCGYSAPMTHTCRACGSRDLAIQGTGTEKIEEQLRERFPEFRIARMDRSSTGGKDKAARLISAFEKHEYDILIGTQMLTKGLDFGKVGLVVVVNADRMIHFPEFRAHERAFQTLVQVAGRTGRRERKDRVIVQTFQPAHPVIRYFLDNDYRGMFFHEMQERRLFKYPPYYRLIKFELKAKNPQTLHEAAEWLRRGLARDFPLVLGPSEPPVPKIRDRYILELLVKLEAGKNTMPARKRMAALLHKFRGVPQFRAVRVRPDADPQN